MRGEDTVLAGRLGRSVRSFRTERGWTLDEASERLGVSRRLLVQIEQAEANPSLSTLLRIAAGFGIGLSELLPTDGRPPLRVVSADDATVLWSTSRGSQARLLVATRELELWEWVLVGGDARSSEAHRIGSQEVISVGSGELVVEVDGHEHVVAAGCSVAVLTDRPHTYRNAGSAAARFTMAVYEPVDGRPG